MEVFITFLAGFSLGWGSAWIARTLPFLNDTDHESLEYNNVGGKTLVDYIDPKFDPENYLRKGK